MKVFETVLISFLTTLSTLTLGILAYWLRNKLKSKSDEKKELKTNKRESLKKLLDVHSDIILNKQYEKGWLNKFSEMSKNILLWASDDILFEYGNYFQKRIGKYEIKEHEIHFANAILAFRKEIGYKNKHNSISPEHIVLIFKSGFDRKV